MTVSGPTPTSANMVIDHTHTEHRLHNVSLPWQAVTTYLLATLMRPSV